MTEFQPTLPAEVPFTDAEIAFMDESPPGLFPENQNSNFGYVIRKIFSDRVQELINQLNTIYNEKFVLTSVTYLDEWEETVGLPVNTGLFTQSQRRNLILNRLRKGPFTRASRRAIVESFITATFGDAPGFDPAGIAIDSSGIPLYSGVFSLAGTYVIREPHPWVQMVPNSSFEVDTSLWAANFGAGGAFVSSTDHAKYGTKSGKFTIGVSGDRYISPVGDVGAMRLGMVAGGTYTWSGQVWVPSGSGTGWVLKIYDGISGSYTSTSSAPISQFDQWVPVSVTRTLRGTANEAFVRLENSTAVAGTSVYIDGAQVEAGSVATDYSDQAETPFAYEVRILNTLGVDVAGLTRELTRVTPAGISFTITQTPSP
jgi:hypothetical protein